MAFHVVSSFLLRVLASKTTLWMAGIFQQPIRCFYFMVFGTLASKRRTPHGRPWKAEPENVTFSCVPLILRSLGHFERCDHLCESEHGLGRPGRCVKQAFSFRVFSYGHQNVLVAVSQLCQVAFISLDWTEAVTGEPLAGQSVPWQKWRRFLLDRMPSIFRAQICSKKELQQW